tara:strand:- start:70 stop:297 length:228 start_codon:yes stop_codon:yes gene_type:complete
MEFVEEMKKEKCRNFQDRIWFIKYWVEKMQNMSDREWTEIQGRFVDSQIQSSREFWAENKDTKSGKRALKHLLKS